MKTVQQRAIERQKQIDAKRKDPRYQRVVGRLAREKLLITNEVPPTAAHPTIEEAIWAGEEVEPRILELLPAIVLRRPRLFMQAKALPNDLAQIVHELKRGTPHTAFRGIPAEKYAYWVEQIGRGRNGKGITVPKTHRFTRTDLEAIEELKKRWNVDETSAIRMALAKAVKK